MARHHYAYTLLLSLALSGCPSTECPTGTLWYPSEGRCRIPDPEDVDGGADAPMGDVPCGGGCVAPAVCNLATNLCVSCLGNDPSTCEGDLRACVDNTCVGCDDDADCTMPGASRCVVATNECAGCTADADCTHLSATPVCDEASSACAACTPDTEAARCGANSCDPATGRCTTTLRSSVTTCGACVSDTECSQPDDRCVPMEFMGTLRAGGFCLKQLDTGCTQPFRTPTPSRSSLSGAPAEVFCGIDESVTTCEAVADLSADSSCTADADCGAEGLDDARCETVNGAVNKCTYNCSTSADCPSGPTCPVAGDRYCGAP